MQFFNGKLRRARYPGLWFICTAKAERTTGVYWRDASDILKCHNYRETLTALEVCWRDNFFFFSWQNYNLVVCCGIWCGSQSCCCNSYLDFTLLNNSKSLERISLDRSMWGKEFVTLTQGWWCGLYSLEGLYHPILYRQTDVFSCLQGVDFPEDFMIVSSCWFCISVLSLMARED